MVNGFADSMNSVNTDIEEKKILGEFGPALNEIVIKRAKANLEKRQAEGDKTVQAFMKKNKSATKTASGLVYFEEIKGTGKQPGENATVEVHYHGTLTDGTVFDSSKLRGETVKFPLKQVIKGWSEGVQMMKEGGKATLLLPSDLAYGDAGSPPVIPGGSTLQFEIELISVVEE